MAKPRLLVAYSNASTFVPTTVEYLNSFRRYSRYEVSYLHVTNDAEIDLDLNYFDAVFQSYCARLCFAGYVSAKYRNALKRFRGVRLLAVQDEYDRTNTLRQAIRDLQFDVVLTCVPQDELEFVYPRKMFPDTEFITVLTGYVPDALKQRERSAIPLAQRPFVIGYRGRNLPAFYGRLGFDKFEIGRRMREICAARGIPHDIEMNEESRIYGEGWYEFLGNCRTTLGTESGCNVFDFDGSLEKRFRSLAEKRNAAPTYEEFRRYTDPLEDKISMGQISPRVFEAAAVGTPMILFAGRYSGIIAPGEHYIELKKDFSNVDAVFDQMEDFDLLSALASRAHEHLVASGSFEYRRFVSMIDAVIDRKRAERGSPQSLGIVSTPTWHAETAADLWHPPRKEVPTAAPREFYYFPFKQLYFEHQQLKREFERLNRAVSMPRAASILRVKWWLLANMPRMASILRHLKAMLRRIGQ